MGKAIVIDEADVVVSRRGRVATFDSDLLDDLKSLKAGKALNLEPYFGKVEDSKARQTVGAEIRKHWKNVRKDEMRLDFGNGIPQVRVKKAS